MLWQTALLQQKAMWTKAESASKAISRCFNKAAATYDQHAHIQHTVGKTLLTLLAAYQVNTKRTIDIGCGTGLTTQQLASAFDYELFHAIDIAEQLLFHAKKRLAPFSVHVYEQDFHHLDCLPVHFDLAFSNMALQWARPLARALAHIYGRLAPKGTLAMSLPLEHTFSNMSMVAKNPLPSAAMVTQMLDKIGFKLVYHGQEQKAVVFPSPLAAFKAIKAVGANHVFGRHHPGLRGKAFFQNILGAKKKCHLAYHIGHFIAKKP